MDSKKQREKEKLILTELSYNPLEKTISPSHLFPIVVDREKAEIFLKKLNEEYQLDKFLYEPKINSKVDSSQIEEILKKYAAQKCQNTQYKSKILEYLYKKKLPNELRKNVVVWMLCSGAEFKKRSNPDYYKTIMSQLFSYPTYFDQTIELVSKDLERTFTDNPERNTKENLGKMRKILQAYSRRNPHIGYCQGMNFLAGNILTYISDEEDAFWILATLIEDILPLDYYSNTHGVLVDQKIFTSLISQLYPDLGEKFDDMQFDASIISCKWFICCFANILNEELVEIVWDLMFTEGSIILHKVALVFVDAMKKSILEFQDFHEIFSLMDKSSDFTKADDFIQRIAKIYLNPKILNLVKKKYEWIVEEELSAVENRRKNKEDPTSHKDLLKCQQKWPVCLDVMHKGRQRNKNGAILSYKSHEIGPIIKNYLDEDFKYTHLHSNQVKSDENKLKTEYSEDPLHVQRNLVLGRQKHTCQETYKLKKKEQKIKSGSAKSSQSSNKEQEKLAILEEYLKNQPSLQKGSHVKMSMCEDDSFLDLEYLRKDLRIEGNLVGLLGSTSLQRKKSVEKTEKEIANDDSTKQESIPGKEKKTLYMFVYDIIEENTTFKSTSAKKSICFAKDFFNQ